MSRELRFSNGQIKNLKVGDTATQISMICSDDGVDSNLSNSKSVEVKVGNASGFLRSQAVAKSDDFTKGKVNLVLDKSFVQGLPPDSYLIEVWVENSDDSTSIYPDNGVLRFSLNQNVQTASGSVITTIAFDDFLSKLDEVCLDQKAGLDSKQPLITDTGWRDVEMKNVIQTKNGNYLHVRAFGPIMAIKIQFGVANGDALTIAKLPDFIKGSWRNFGTNTPGMTVMIDDSHNLQVRAPTGPFNSQLNVDITFMAD